MGIVVVMDEVGMQAAGWMDGWVFCLVFPGLEGI